MEIKSREKEGVTILDLKGRIMDGLDPGRFVEVLKGHIKEGKVDFVLNMEGIKWVNATGLGALVSGFHTAKKGGGSMKMYGLTERMDYTLNISQLRLVFETYETEQEALDSYKTDGENYPV